MTVDGTQPHVGIFWRVQAARAAPNLLVDSVQVANAEPYGEFLTHGGHYEFWSEIADLSAVELRRRALPDVAKWSEYEEWPRGRVIFHVPSNRFIVYAGRKLMAPTMIGRIVERFGLPEGGFDVRGDPHYVSVREPKAEIAKAITASINVNRC